MNNKMKVCFLVFFLFVLVSIGKVKAGVANRSEIRGLFLHYPTFNNPDWDLIAQTAKDLKQNALYFEVMTSYSARYNSSIVPHTDRDHLAEAIQAAHSRGIEVHAMMLVLMIWEGYGYDEPVPEDWKVTACDGSKVNWLDPCHPDARNHIKSLVEELATNYDIDGFMFDYIRYNREDTSVSQYCRDMFENDTGITISNWPDDVCYGGEYHNEFMEWRIKSITDLVRNMNSWMLAIKPDLEFSAAAFGVLYQNERCYPTYNRRAIAQDPADWIRQGYLDVVAPMGYTNDIDQFKGTFSCGMRYFGDSPEGTIPVIKFTSNDVTPTIPVQFEAKIDAIRELGADGWVVWRYGGPGDNSAVTPDIREYFENVDLPDTFSLGNVQAFPDSTEAIITWITDRPVTSKVEYNTTPLFNWSIKTDYNYQCGCDFPYWEPEHINGTILENNTQDTIHSVKLTGLQENTTYYFRVQSQDESGIASSKVYNFTTGIGDYPVNITGNVIDLETGLPIQGTLVTCNTSADITNENGVYLIMMPSTGSCDLTASKTNYNTKSTYFEFLDSGTYNYEFVLEPIKVDIVGNLKDKDDIPVQANIEVYQEGMSNIIETGQTNSTGYYNLSLQPGTYDIQFNFPDIFIPNFFIKLLSFDVLSNIYDLINDITSYDSNSISFIADVSNNQIIQINSEMPNRVILNGSEIGNVSSLSELKENTWYYSDGNLYLKIKLNLMTDCIFECCKGEERYYDKSCPSNYYCLDRVCQPKTECPFDCCENEETYLNKSCNLPEYCVNRNCVECSGNWTFDDCTATDSSGNGNDGTINGATCESTNCHSGSCLSFDGIDDYVLVPDSDSLNLTGEITLEAWVYPAGPWSGDYPGIVAKYWPTGYLLGIRNSSSTWGFWLRSSSGFGSIPSDSTINFNQWVHLAVVRDSSNTMRMYINGVEQSDTTVFGDSISSSGRDFEIGRWGLRYFNGTIDEVWVYNRALTPEEILAHASA